MDETKPGVPGAGAGPALPTASSSPEPRKGAGAQSGLPVGTSAPASTAGLLAWFLGLSGHPKLCSPTTSISPPLLCPPYPQDPSAGGVLPTQGFSSQKTPLEHERRKRPALSSPWHAGRVQGEATRSLKPRNPHPKREAAFFGSSGWVQSVKLQTNGKDIQVLTQEVGLHHTSLPSRSRKPRWGAGKVGPQSTAGAAAGAATPRRTRGHPARSPLRAKHERAGGGGSCSDKVSSFSCAFKRAARVFVVGVGMAWGKWKDESELLSLISSTT